ncbi:APMAP protein, partial [Polyodon spathula]|nr:APMAP protein [Polyodon spathula]
MFFSSYSGKVFRVTLVTLAVSLLIPLIGAIILLESPIEPQYLSFPEPPLMSEALEPNFKLRQAERLFEGQLIGPESMANIGGVLYTGTADGKIIKIEDGKMHTLATLGRPPCGTQKDELTCGRPLGIRASQNRTLFVADAYLGIFEVNPFTGKVEVLVPTRIPVNGKSLSFVNDLDVTRDGRKIYFTDSSSKWQRRDYAYLIMEGINDGRSALIDSLRVRKRRSRTENQPGEKKTRKCHSETHLQGAGIVYHRLVCLWFCLPSLVNQTTDPQRHLRDKLKNSTPKIKLGTCAVLPNPPVCLLCHLLEYDTFTKEVTVLMDDLRFPNGVQLSPNEDFVLVAEMTMARIRRCYVSGLNKGGLDLFVENLPGFPDNIRSSSSGGYWVAMSAVRPNPGFSMLDFLSQKPWIKKIIFKLLSQEALMQFLPKYSLVMELYDNGVCKRSFHDPHGTVATYVSEAHELDGYLYLGSFRSPFLCRLNLSEV